MHFIVLLSSIVLWAGPAKAAPCRDELERGSASWYGPGFDGAKTKSGEAFDAAALTAAHQTLPMGTILRVINLRNAKSVVVRINDRGAFKTHVIDVSESAAQKLDMMEEGIAPVALYLCR
jgi:rare lipoprotein A